MALQLGAGRQQKAWQPSGGLAFSLKSPSSLCSPLLPAHFHPSVPSLFNWHSVKVLLSASTCPCHGKQRQLRDAALSPLSAVCTLFCLLLLLSFLSPFPPLAFLPSLLSLPRSGICLCFTVTLSPFHSAPLFAFPWPRDKRKSSLFLSRLSHFFFLPPFIVPFLPVKRPAELFANSFLSS